MARVISSKCRPLASEAQPQVCGLDRLSGGEWYAYGMCIFYMLLNQAEVYKNKNLAVVIGSFGLGMGASPFYEHGNPTNTAASQFIHSDGRSTDLHMWLEDGEGRVYDVLGDELLAVAMIRGQRTDALASHVEVVRGVAKADLAARGFHYVPALPAVQQDLWTHMLRVHAAPLADMGLTLPAKLSTTAA
jgi:hypothetical protein